MGDEQETIACTCNSTDNLLLHCSCCCRVLLIVNPHLQGGHFAAWEQPQLLYDDIIAFVDKLNLR